MPSVVTANRLASGEVVYLAREGQWVRNLGDAEVASDKIELANLEAAAGRAIAEREVTAVYAFDVAVVDGRPAAQSVKEKIRAAHGPTV